MFMIMVNQLLVVPRESAILEVVAGLKEYFDVMLGKQLLYKFERPQYADMLRTHTGDTAPQMSEVSRIELVWGVVREWVQVRGV